MRTKILFFVLFCFGIVQSISAQDVTIKMQNVRVKEVFNEISRRTEIAFEYASTTVDDSRIVSVDARRKDVMDVVSELFKGLDVKIERSGNKIILRAAPQKSTEEEDQGPRSISGAVFDDEKLPLVGVTILVKGTNIGTTTALDGSFSLKSPVSNPTIEVSYIGYDSYITTVSSATSHLNITLNNSTNLMEDVVVVGYGTTRKENLTGAVDQISSKEIEGRGATGNTSQLLQGVIPSLNVTISSGQINKKGSMDVRGVGSINGGEPLVLIDGVDGDIDYINPKDIESITVLKDAASAAIYGARAAFGVVLVTTKKAKKGATKVSYSNNFGWSSPTINTDNFITDGLEWAQLSDRASLLESTSTYLGYTEEDYEYMRRRKEDPSLPAVLIKNVDGVERYVHYGNTDWWDYIFQDNQPSQEHNINISGGNDDIRFYLSGRYYSREGIYRINPDKLRSYTLRSKIEFNVKPNIKIANSTNVFMSRYTYPVTNTRNVGGSDNSEDWRKYTFHASPLFMPTNPDGSIMIQSAYSPGRDIADGTFADLTYGKSNGMDQETDISNTTSIEYKPIKDLVINADYSFRKGRPQSELLRVATPHTNQPNGAGSVLYKPNTELYKEMQWTTMYQAVNAYATYSHTFNENHNFRAMAGFNQEWRHWERSVARRSSPISEDLGSFNLANGDLVQVQGNADEWALRSGFTRLNYDYKGRYLVEFNGRMDMSSKFPEDSRMGLFPSGSAAWRVSEERFFEPIKPYVGNLKLRFSYGTLGNQDVGPYDYIAKMKVAQGSYLFDSAYNSYLTTPDAISSNFTWEKSETINGGVDISMFRNRLTASFDYYHRNTTDMLTQGKQLPSVFGTTEPEENAARLKTKGFELSVKWRDSFTVANRPLSYSVGFSLADNKTVITSFDNPNGDFTQYYVGKELGEIWGYSIEGFFHSDDEYLTHADQALVNKRIENNYLINHPVAGDLKFADLDGDGKITPGDKTLANPGDLKVIGNTSPRYFASFNLGADYAGFDLNIFLQGVLKRDWWPGKDNGFFWGPFTRQYENFIPKSIMDDSWTPENPNAYFPRLAVYAANEGGDYEGSQLRVYSDKYLQNAAYVRVKDITLGYTLPEKLTKKICLERLRVYVSGQNLFTFSPIYRHNPDHTIDPEQLGTGNTYPYSKTYSFGVDVTF